MNCVASKTLLRKLQAESKEEAMWWRNVKLLNLSWGTLFLENKLVCFKSCDLLSCFNEILLMYQVVLSFTVAFWELFN